MIGRMIDRLGWMCWAIKMLFLWRVRLGSWEFHAFWTAFTWRSNRLEIEVAP